MSLKTIKKPWAYGNLILTLGILNLKMEYECTEMDIEEETSSSTATESIYNEIGSSFRSCNENTETSLDEISDDTLEEVKDTEGM